MKLERTKTGWSVQLRFGAGRRKRFAMPQLDAVATKDLEKAEARRVALEELAGLLTERQDAADLLEYAASRETDLDFTRSIRTAKLALSKPGPAPRDLGPRTFRDVAELWLSGELHRRYPDEVEDKGETSVATSRGILQAIYHHLPGPIERLTTEDMKRAKAAATPAGIGQAQRGAYARHIRIVMGLAVEPLGLIAVSPVPPKFVPSYGHKRALGFLYPEEDAILLGAPDEVVPYHYRLYYGFQDRNGTRPSEGLDLTWGDFDLKLGAVTLDKNKTDSPRAWKLSDDVTRVLRGERERTGADDDALVFAGIERTSLAKTFRRHLWAAGVRRRELHRSTDERRPIRVHDLRGSFVTIALGSGMTEDWVMRRTGHTESSMLAKYRRQVEHVRELDLGWYGELDECLSGQLRHGIEGVARGVARKVKTSVEIAGCQTLRWSYLPLSSSTSEPKTPTSARESLGTQGAGVAGIPQVARAGHPVGEGVARSEVPLSAPQDTPAAPVDPVEKALAYALEAATRAEQWAVVLEVTRELSERRRARTAPTVPSLSDARAKREKGEGK